MNYEKIIAPSKGEKITLVNGSLQVPANPIIAFIEGNGTGVDIWAACKKLFDSAVEKVYKGERKINWIELYAGEKAQLNYGSGILLPDETISAMGEYLVTIKGPIKISSEADPDRVNRLIQQKLELDTCQRPVRYFNGLPSPVKKPEHINIIIFKNNHENIHKDIELCSEKSNQLNQFLLNSKIAEDIPLKEGAFYTLKTQFKEESKKVIRAGIEYAIHHNKSSVTLIQDKISLVNGCDSFVNWGYEVARKEFGDRTIARDDCSGNPPVGKILIKDLPMELFTQHTSTRPYDYSVVVALGVQAEFIYHSLSSQAGPTGITPQAFLNSRTRVALFEPTHCTAAKYAGLDKANPSALILSGIMMFRYINWYEVADKIEEALEKTFASQTVTFDIARLVNGAKELKCSAFANHVAEQIK